MMNSIGRWYFYAIDKNLDCDTHGWNYRAVGDISQWEKQVCSKKG